MDFKKLPNVIVGGCRRILYGAWRLLEGTDGRKKLLEDIERRKNYNGSQSKHKGEK